MIGTQRAILGEYHVNSFLCIFYSGTRIQYKNRDKRIAIWYSSKRLFRSKIRRKESVTLALLSMDKWPISNRAEGQSFESRRLAALNKELYSHIYSCRKTLRRLLTFVQRAVVLSLLSVPRSPFSFFIPFSLLPALPFSFPVDHDVSPQLLVPSFLSFLRSRFVLCDHPPAFSRSLLQLHLLSSFFSTDSRSPKLCPSCFRPRSLHHPFYALRFSISVSFFPFLDLAPTILVPKHFWRFILSSAERNFKSGYKLCSFSPL